MELPVSSASYRPTDDALVRAVKRARLVLGRTGGTEHTLEGAVTLTCPSRPGVRCVNAALECKPQAGSSAAELWGQVEAHFAAAGTRCLTVDAAEQEPGTALATVLADAGFRLVRKQVSIYQAQEQPGRPDESVQLVPARAVYGELPAFYRHVAAHEQRSDERTTVDLAQTLIDRLDEPRLEMFAVRVDRRTAGVAGVVTLGQIGVIVPPWVDPDRRGRGLGKTLVLHVLDHCRRAQFEQVLIERSEGCPSIPFDRKLGFVPLTMYPRWVRA